MYNLAEHIQSFLPTWQSSRYQSTIDYIWAHNPILRYLSKFETDQSNTSTNSDHTILISRQSFLYALFKTRRYSTKTHRKVFDYKSMNSEQWQNFSDQVTQNLTLNHTPLSTITTESLETTWHKIQTSIINAALQHIPYKKFKVRNFQYNFSSKATKLHYNLKKLSNIIRQIKIVIKNQTSIPLHLNQNINYINTQHQVNILLLPTTHNLLPNQISTTNLEQKALFYAHNIENTKEIRQQINNAISKRCNKLATNPTSMINSILNCYKDPVKFNNINTDTSTITEPYTIKNYIHNYFNQ